MPAPIPVDESQRLEALRRYQVLDTLAEQSYDDITSLAAYIAQVPMAVISFVDAHRQWFKSTVGLGSTETSREVAFCAHAILTPDTELVVPDALLDNRFSANPLVTGAPNIRFYLGAPLVTPDNHALGTLCVLDRVPRSLSKPQVEALRALSRQAVTQLELRRNAEELRAVTANTQVHLEQLESYRHRLEASNSQLLQKTLTDHLTGVGNRAAFDQMLGEEFYRAKRYGTALSLLLLDVDHFKHFNDTFGHPAGDAALQAVAKALGCARPSDFVARYGGEEFAIVLPTTGARGALVIAERARNLVQTCLPRPQGLTVSIGAALLQPNDADTSRLCADADRALYAAKSGGRNRVVHADTLPR